MKNKNNDYLQKLGWKQLMTSISIKERPISLVHNEYLHVKMQTIHSTQQATHVLAQL